MSFELLILLVCDITNLVLAVAIYLRSPHSRVNQIFAGLSASIVVWTTLNFAADHVSQASLSLWLTRLTLAAGLLILLCVILLSRNFPRRLAHADKLSSVQPALLLATALVTLTPLIISSVTIGEQGAELHIGPLYYVFVLIIIEGAALTVRNFMSQSRHTKSATEKDQIRIVVAGLILFAIFTITSNVLLPLVLDSWSSSRFGPLFSLFIVGLTGYAIIRHKLFDIRPILARSIGYLFSVVVLALAYGFLVFGFAQAVFNLSIPLGTQIFLALATGVSGLLFQRFRKTFDRLTNKIFFRDAYESQELFDHLNKVLVSTVDLNNLLKQSSMTIMDSLKVSSCSIAIKDGESSGMRIIGTEKLPFNPVELLSNRMVISQIRLSVIATDFLDDQQIVLRDTLRQNNVGAIVRLSANLKKPNEDMGYIVLGPKRSGNTFTGQDFQVLDTVANELIIAIQNALRYEEIENFAATMQQKVDDATHKLRKTNEKLKALDEAKDDFVSMASHQLRTPLTSIKGYTSMVLEGDAGKINATQRKLLEQSFFSSQRMVYLIADLLNVSRLKTGKFIIESTPVNLAEVVSQEIVQLKETAAGRQLQLTYDMPKDFPNLMLDETKTRQVIMNFVDNAIYYTPAGGHIKVELVETPASVELRVIDDGIGVPKHEQPHLFTKFYRAGNARKARPDGTGLGLFMAKKVVAAEGGAIIFETEEGKGSTFGFVFSKSKLAPEADA